jgi:hypothetical protein
VWQERTLSLEPGSAWPASVAAVACPWPPPPGPSATGPRNASVGIRWLWRYSLTAAHNSLGAVTDFRDDDSGTLLIQVPLMRVMRRALLT